MIAAVNGAAMAADCVWRSPPTSGSRRHGAYFRAAGINNGLTASELGLSYFSAGIGSSRAFEIMLTGRDIDAEEAERIGLVSRQVPEANSGHLLRPWPSESPPSRGRASS